MNLPDAVKTAHSLSPQGRAKLKAAIAATFGPQEAIVKEPSPAELEAKKRAQVLAEEAKRAEAEKQEREAAQVEQIIATLANPELFDETRAGALRAIAEVIGVADAPDVESPPAGKVLDLEFEPEGGTEPVKELLDPPILNGEKEGENEKRADS